LAVGNRAPITASSAARAMLDPVPVGQTPVLLSNSQVHGRCRFGQNRVIALPFFASSETLAWRKARVARVEPDHDGLAMIPP
jgi:hypothetical protein